MSDPPTSDRDRDCAVLARAALFPLQINRDGTHPTIFPALEALGKVRDDATVANPDRAESSFFPSRVVVVKSIGGTDGKLQFNGQPDINESDASFDVIPRMLSIKCMECADLHPGKVAFTRLAKVPANERELEKHREVVVCSDRALAKSAVVEEGLASEVTRARDRLKSDRGDTSADATSCKGLAASEIRAARAAQCYYSKHGKELKRGSLLPVGYSLLPESLQRLARDRCIRSTAAKSTGENFGAEDGRRCVGEIFDEVMRDN